MYLLLLWSPMEAVYILLRQVIVADKYLTLVNS